MNTANVVPFPGCKLPQQNEKRGSIDVLSRPPNSNMMLLDVCAPAGLAREFLRKCADAGVKIRYSA